MSIPLGTERNTYGAASTAVLAPAITTDFFTISGVAGKVIRIKNISIGGTQTTASNENIILLKRSTLNTGGTSSLLTKTSFDSSNPSSTAVVRVYTASPTTLGTLVGSLSAERFLIPTATTLGQTWTYNNFDGAQDITLRSATELLAINFNGVAMGAGTNLSVDITWTESDN